jgi:tetratricopeptide (TPR) repeat protein
LLNTTELGCKNQEDGMDNYSFGGQDKRAGIVRSTGALMTTKSSSASSSQKRWQPKQKQSHKAVGAGQPAQQKQSTPRLTPAEQDSLLRQKALLEAQQGNYVKAIVIYTLLIERNPDSANDYSNRGLVYFQNGQKEAAIADYDQAIELNPRLDSAYNNRANYHAAEGQFLEAILDYDIALDLNPANVRAWINQGITFRELEMYDRALESFDLALCLGKLEGHIYAQRGRTYHLRGDWNCAMADYQRAIVALSESTVSSMDASARLQSQVDLWISELLSPLQF